MKRKEKGLIGLFNLQGFNVAAPSVRKTRLSSMELNASSSVERLLEDNVSL